MTVQHRLSASEDGTPRTLPPASAGGWQRASTGELWLLAGYFFALVALTDLFNVRLGVEFLIPAVIVAAIAITRMPVLFFRDWWFVLAGMVLWAFSGAVAAHSPFPWQLEVLLHTDWLIGLGHQPVQEMQSHFWSPGHVGWLDWLAAGIYNVHVTEPFVAGYFLWRLNRGVYLQFAAALLTLFVVADTAFILFPAVPPWLAAYKLVHAQGKYLFAGGWPAPPGDAVSFSLHYVRAHGHVYLPGVRNLFGPVLAAHPQPFHGSALSAALNLPSDAVAAFPSEHAAIPLLEVLAFRLVNKWVALVLGLWALAVLVAVVYLGEHWVTDVLAGWVFSLVVFGCVRWWVTRGKASPHRS